MYGRNNTSHFKPARSIDAQFKSGVSQLKSDHEEDLEFQKYEMNALYQSKVDDILLKKTKKQQTKEILTSLKSNTSLKSVELFENNDIEHVFETTLQENASLKAKNADLLKEIEFLKQKFGPQTSSNQ